MRTIPPEAVRHKMEKDGVSAKIIALVLGEAWTETKASRELTEEEEKAVASELQKDAQDALSRGSNPA
jgi:hypothetical protein